MPKYTIDVGGIVFKDNLLFVACENIINVFNINTSLFLFQLDSNNKSKKYCIELHPFKNWIFVGSDCGIVELIDISTNTILQEYKPHCYLDFEFSSSVYSIIIGGNDDIFISYNYSYKIKRYNITSGINIKDYECRFYIKNMIFDKITNRLFISGNNIIKFLNVETANIIHHEISLNDYGYINICFIDASHNLLASISKTNVITIWDARNFEIIKNLSNNNNENIYDDILTNYIFPVSDGIHLISYNSIDQIINIWDIYSETCQIFKIKDIGSDLCIYEISHDGNYIIIGKKDDHFNQDTEPVSFNIFSILPQFPFLIMEEGTRLKLYSDGTIREFTLDNKYSLISTITPTTIIKQISDNQFVINNRDRKVNSNETNALIFTTCTVLDWVESLKAVQHLFSNNNLQKNDKNSILYQYRFDIFQTILAANISRNIFEIIFQILNFK